ncbi:TetR/AcrR family transcriptional regulator [Parasphingopyxis marina]|uniref:TetR/AcrR family transcriptional regulator n=1 Tax=Parasphingopyxis marina TaxID=2761622 RepID=A0A842HW65_9SPHN|nr:TetR/AcrR family transcriptional regulator [Parasphingopyxis marina]MBC2776601.1 TetR/AcrR family transcriptional regulator [Parasphingopyxis marina]
MARPQTDHEAAAEKLLAAAEELVRERGPVQITITDIANACGMSQSNVYRFFPSKEALWEAFAERWFRELNEIMEEVVASDLEPREKLYQFFARRLIVKKARFEEDPDYFNSCMILGDEHRDVVMSYVDLADHYMAMILAEAIGAGEFKGMKVDRLMTLVNLMLAPFCDPVLMVRYRGATPENLRYVIDAIFEGFGEADAVAPKEMEPLRIAS